MARRGTWTVDEKEKLAATVDGSQNYCGLAQSLGRSLWAVECQVIKLCRERGDDPCDFGITEASVDKYDHKNKETAEKSSLALEEKKLLVKALNSYMDIGEIKGALTEITSRLSKIESLLLRSDYCQA